jgi:lysozyme
MLALLNKGDYSGAAKQFIRWNKETKRGVKVGSAGLTKRRIAERNLFLKA